MKVAASIFSWLGGIITAVSGFIFLSQGRQIAAYYLCDSYGCSYISDKVGYPSWAWDLWMTYSFIILLILFWREGNTHYGKKVGCGICTLLFCSLIGGILTLCIPKKDLR